MINALQDFLGMQFIQSLGLTFIHSLWQATLIAGLLYLILQGIHESSARTRYIAASTALCVVLITAIFTFFYCYGNSEEANNGGSYLLMAHSNVLSEASPTTSFSLLSDWQSYLEPAFPSIIFCWIIGMLIYSSRLALGAFAIQQIKKSGYPVQKKYKERLVLRANQMGIRKKIEWKVTNLVAVPMVIGYMKPVILFPVAMLNQLSINEVESIIVHELAHIKRLDFIQNIVQSMIESIFYYHPAVWFISNVIRKERENCCDDQVVEICGNSIGYAKTLLRVQNTQVGATPSIAVPLFKQKKVLLNRVQRILNQPNQKSNIMEKLFATAACLICFMLLTISSSFQAQVPIEKKVIEPQKEILEEIVEGKLATVVELIEPDIEEVEIELAEVREWTEEVKEEEPTLAEIQEVALEELLMAGSEKMDMASIDLNASENLKIDLLNLAIVRDSIPKGKSRTINKISKRTDDGAIQIEIRDDVVTKLKIDGREIPASEYGEYKKMIAELKAENETHEVRRTVRGYRTSPRVESALSMRRHSAPTPPTPPSLDELDTPEGREAYKKARAEFLKEMDEYNSNLKNAKVKLRENLKRSRGAHDELNHDDGTDVYIYEGDGDGLSKIILKGNPNVKFKDGKYWYSADSSVTFENLNGFFERGEGFPSGENFNFNWKDQKYFDGENWILSADHNHFDSLLSNFKFDNIDGAWMNKLKGDSLNYFWLKDGGHSNKIFEKLYKGKNEDFKWIEKGNHDILEFYKDAQGSYFKHSNPEEMKQLLEKAKGYNFEYSRRNNHITNPFEMENREESVIIKRMLEEGLISDEDGYSIHLTKKKLKINGEKMPSSIQSKYVRLYERINGKSFGDKDKLVIAHKASVKF